MAKGTICGIHAISSGAFAAAMRWVVRGGHRVRKDTRNNQGRWLAIDLAAIAGHRASENEILAR